MEEKKLSLRQQKLVRKLGTRKGRTEVGAFLVEGTKLTLEALASSHSVKEVIATEQWIQANSSAVKACPLTVVSEKVLNEFARLEVNTDCLAVVERPNDRSFQWQSGLNIVLDRIIDPGNLGTIIRLVDWYGLSQITCVTGTVDAYNYKVVQASMGSIFRVAVNYMSARELEEQLNAAQFPIFKAEMEGQSLYDHPFTSIDAILVMGSESHGISLNLNGVGKAITIPRVGNAESLNVAMATSIIASHYFAANH